jgi:uncharacterized protein YbcI
METQDETRPWQPGATATTIQMEDSAHAFGHQERRGLELQEITNAMVGIYKELLGRGPTKARSAYAGPDTLIATLETSLTPVERHMVALGEHQRVREIRTMLQHASERNFVETVERITGRRVRAFVSGTDTREDVSCEVFYFESVAGEQLPEGGQARR